MNNCYTVMCETDRCPDVSEKLGDPEHLLIKKLILIYFGGGKVC